MRFLADESLEVPVIKALREKGYDVTAIIETFPSVFDDIVLQNARDEKRILLTCDKDFGELVFRLKLVSEGIVLLRLPELDNNQKSLMLLKCIEQYGAELSNNFCVLSSNKLRVVPLNR